MFKYCIASTFDPGEDQLTRFYCIKKNSKINWSFNVSDPDIVWYDSFEEAESNLLEDGEYVISSFFPVVAAVS